MENILLVCQLANFSHLDKRWNLISRIVLKFTFGKGFRGKVRLAWARQVGNIGNLYKQQIDIQFMVAASEFVIPSLSIEFQFIFGTVFLNQDVVKLVMQIFFKGHLIRPPYSCSQLFYFFALWYFCPCLDNKVYLLNSIQFHGFMGIKLINGKILCLEFIACLVEQEILRFICYNVFVVGDLRC